MIPFLHQMEEDSIQPALGSTFFEEDKNAYVAGGQKLSKNDRMEDKLQSDGVMKAKEAISNVSGISVVIGITYLCVRTFQRRAEFGKTQRLAELRSEPSKVQKEKSRKQEEEYVEPTSLNTFSSSFYAGIIGTFLFKIATIVEEYLKMQTLPTAYAMRNIFIATKTMTEGTLYLAAFVFILASVGLFLLGFQVTFRPEPKEAENVNSLSKAESEIASGEDRNLE